MKYLLTTQRKFCEYDIFRIFMRIGEREKIDRARLAKICDIGEGSVRTILEILERKKLVERRKKGNTLTKQGMRYFCDVKEILSPVKKVKFDVFKDGFSCFGCIVRKYGKEKIKSLYKARDYAIRAGCNSAMVLIRTKNHVKIPYVRKWNFDELLNEFCVERNNLIVLTSAERKRIAENGILAICIYLSDELDKIFKKLCTS